MPRTPRNALLLLAGFWLALLVLEPLLAPWAWAEDPELSRLELQLQLDVNRFRAEHHLVALERRADLDAVARAHSEDMVKRGFFAHENPDSEVWWQRMDRAGVRGYTLAGENVAVTNEADPHNAVFVGWQNSPAHRENLLARPFNATGIGIARHPDGRLFYTQLYVTFPR